MTDLEIAQSNQPLPIGDIAQKLGIDEKYVIPYGKNKAKIDLKIKDELRERQVRPGKLILVTAITPTQAGEGKTTTSIGLADGLRCIGKKAMVALREPSLGPVFGIKGGAAGGGYAQIVPMEDINLHFTGDIHAITAANNLLAAMLDNHIYQGNELNIDPRKITFRRCMDMNDRQLRNIVNGLGGSTNGVPREDGFDISVASEVMAVFCLAQSVEDLKERLGNIIVAYTYDNQLVRARQLGAAGAMCALLKDALMPNLVQTLEHTPAFVHGGPFANIAHGCNSVLATGLAMQLCDYTVTEAGFGADLGAEKFFDIKCRSAGLCPDAVVLVATVRALKMHGGVAKGELSKENCAALERGFANLKRHADNIRNVYGLPCIVAMNRFPTDTDAELDLLREKCRSIGLEAILCDAWARGGKGATDLARAVVDVCEEPKPDFRFSYEISDTIEDKIRAVVSKIYGGKDASFTASARKEMKRLEELGFGGLPVCIAKTQYSFSDDPSLTGAPEGFSVSVKSMKVSAGAGFIVVLTGNIMTMPGLPAKPAALAIDVDQNGVITGLF